VHVLRVPIWTVPASAFRRLAYQSHARRGHYGDRILAQMIAGGRRDITCASQPAIHRSLLVRFFFQFTDMTYFKPEMLRSNFDAIMLCLTIQLETTQRHVRNIYYAMRALDGLQPLSSDVMSKPQDCMAVLHVSLSVSFN
jgi:hypothetical protein